MSKGGTLSMTPAAIAAREWRAKNPSKNRAAVRRWDKAHPGYKAASARLWYKNNRERANARRRMEQAAGKRRHIDRRKTLKAKYGLTVEAYDEMLVKQNGKCAICLLPPRNKYLDVDHCHDSDRVRGLLCDLCNRMLGQAREDPALLEAGARYLREVSNF
jgi:hypothetical protein